MSLKHTLYQSDDKDNYLTYNTSSVNGNKNFFLKSYASVYRQHHSYEIQHLHVCSRFYFYIMDNIVSMIKRKKNTFKSNILPSYTVRRLKREPSIFHIYFVSLNYPCSGNVNRLHVNQLFVLFLFLSYLYIYLLTDVNTLVWNIDYGE